MSVIATITCAGNPAAVLKSLQEAGANAEIDEGTLIINTRLGREVLDTNSTVTVEENVTGKVFIVEASRENNPDATTTGVVS